MTIQTKDARLEIKEIHDAGVFEGVAGIYGAVDLQNDILVKGCFTKAISEQPESGFPLLWCHDQARPIGLCEIQDSPRALKVLGRLDRSDADGEIAYQRAKKGLVKGISIGFTVPNSDSVKYTDGIRYLKEIRLHELSLVAVPAQPGAQVLAVKQLGDAVRLLKSSSSIDAEDLAELKNLETEVRRLLAADPARQAESAFLGELQKLAADIRRL